MIVNLDNELIFRKVFTNKLVFKSFVHDVIGIDIDINSIETEKRIAPKIGYFDFKLDIFAESTDKKTAIEIQRVESDDYFDLFLHYFLMLVTEQQKKANAYNINQTVYVIVLLTSPYTINDKQGQPIQEEVMVLNINPETLTGKVQDLYGHQLICLNPNHPCTTTPKKIRDWLDLFKQSTYNTQKPELNINNPGIKKVIELISYENLSLEEQTLLNNKELNSTAIARVQTSLTAEIVKNAIQEDLDIVTISKITGFSEERIRQIKQDFNF